MESMEFLSIGILKFLLWVDVIGPGVDHNNEDQDELDPEIA